MNTVNRDIAQESEHPIAEMGRGSLRDLIELSGDQAAQPESVSAPLNPACFVCGEENPHGLHLGFQTEDRRAFARWTPCVGSESYKGIIHGGIIASVLDEAMSKAIISGGEKAFTADLRIRFRRKVCVGDVVLVNGWVVSVEKRRIQAEASIMSEEGEERAHAWGVFLVARHF